MRELTHISLFAGIGGIDLAAEWAGFRTILFVEINPFCQKVLERHWPDVPIIGDIRDATKETIAHATSQRPHKQENKQELEREGGNELYAEQPGDTKAVAHAPGGKPGEQEARNGGQDTGRGGQEGSARGYAPISPVTLVTGGFPCQPVSVAGKRRGKDDDRWLWPDMLRVISEVRPAWVVAENVAGLLHLGFYDVLSSLEGAGYETIPFVIPACGVNAPHRRDRIFIVAHTTGNRCDEEQPEAGLLEQALRQASARELGGAGGPQDVADTIIGAPGTTHRKRSDKRGADSKQDNRNSLGDDIGNSGQADTNSRCISPQIQTSGGFSAKQIIDGESWWAVEPNVGRVAHGVPDRVDRLKCLGNAVVPQQIYPILKAIADIERAKWTGSARKSGAR